MWTFPIHFHECPSSHPPPYTDLEFNAKTGQWNMHVLCDDLKSYVFSEKPRPIIFSRDDMPTGLPSYLGMKSSFDKEFANIERSISR